MLSRIELPTSIADQSVPPEVAAMMADVRRRVGEFQDRWDVPQIEQFVAADYELVYLTLDWIRRTQLVIGNRFLEWGCGFAAVATLAARIGYDVIGIEAEATLIQHGQQTVDAWVGVDGWCDPDRVELVRGDFLPPGSETLADDPTLPSLNHGIGSAYDSLGLELDDFAIVYSYPWPGEDDFHEAVFDAYAADGAILVHFRGPYEMAVWRKTASRRNESGRSGVARQSR